MSIELFFRHRRFIIGGLLPLLSAMLLTSPAVAGRWSDGTDAKSTEVRWNLADNVIIINYDLDRNPNVKCRIEVLMRSESDSSFRAVPQSVEGDVGEGYFAGANREIQWHFLRDFPQGIAGKDYYFEIHIREAEPEGTSGWLYFALGAVAVTGGAFAFIMSKNQPDLPSLTTK